MLYSWNKGFEMSTDFSAVQNGGLIQQRYHSKEYYKHRKLSSLKISWQITALEMKYHNVYLTEFKDSSFHFWHMHDEERLKL